METFRQNEGQFLVQKEQMSLEKHKTGQKSRAECKAACNHSTTPPLSTGPLYPTGTSCKHKGKIFNNVGTVSLSFWGPFSFQGAS